MTVPVDRLTYQHLVLLAASIAVLTLSSFQSLAETWTDVSGKYSIEAEFLRIDGKEVLLKRSGGKLVRVALAKLDPQSRNKAERRAKQNAGEGTLGKVANLKDAAALERLAKSQRSALRALRLYEEFLKQADLKEEDVERAGKKLDTWRDRSDKKMFRWGRRWETVDQIKKRVEKEEKLLREAHRLIEVNNDKLARERFEEASDENPEGVRADFYLGMLHSLVGRYPKGGLERFSLCVKRLQSHTDRIGGGHQSNLIAALNNRAICYARRGKHKEALEDWKAAIRIAPQTPELIQNLGYYAQLCGVVDGWGVSRRISDLIADQYAHLTVVNQSDSYSHNTGFLFIPYVDAPALPDFEDFQLVPGNAPLGAGDFPLGEGSPESDVRVVRWITGVAVGKDLIVVPRIAAEGATGFWIRRDGQLSREHRGKIVAISGTYDLALVRMKGLNAVVVPLETADSTRAMDIHVVGFAQPGILRDGVIVQKGNVVDLTSTYVPLGKQYLSRAVSLSAREGNEDHAGDTTKTVMETIAIPIGADYITELIHDVPINLGGEGSALLNRNGRVVGIDTGLTASSLREGDYRTALNHTQIRSFLDTTGLDFPELNTPTSGPVSDVQRFAQGLEDSAIFQLAVIGLVPRLSWSQRLSEIRGIQTKTGWNAYEDPWCIRCDGRGQVVCHGRRCVEGRVSHKETSIIGRLPGTGDPVYDTKWVYEPCSVCGGDGFLRCPHCSGNQVEPLIR